MTVLVKAKGEIKDPIVRIEAKAKTGLEEEQLAAVMLLGKYGPDAVEQLPPSPEVLEALEFAHEMAETAVARYRELLLGYQLHTARKARIPGYGDEHAVETETKDPKSLPSTEEKKKDWVN